MAATHVECSRISILENQVKELQSQLSQQQYNFMNYRLDQLQMCQYEGRVNSSIHAIESNNLLALVNYALSNFFAAIQTNLMMLRPPGFTSMPYTPGSPYYAVPPPPGFRCVPSVYPHPPVIPVPQPPPVVPVPRPPPVIPVPQPPPVIPMPQPPPVIPMPRPPPSVQVPQPPPVIPTSQPSPRMAPVFPQQPASTEVINNDKSGRS